MHAILDRVSMAPGTGCQNEYTPRRGRNKSTREILQLGASYIIRGGAVSQYGASASVLLGGIAQLLLVFVNLWRAHYHMHCNYTSRDLSYCNTGLGKCPVILQYLSTIDELQVIDSFRSYLLILRPPGEDEVLERGDGGGGVVLAGADVRAVEEPELDLDRLLPAGHLPAGSPPRLPPKIREAPDQKCMAQKGPHGIHANRPGLGF